MYSAAWPVTKILQRQCWWPCPEAGHRRGRRWSRKAASRAIPAGRRRTRQRPSCLGVLPVGLREMEQPVNIGIQGAPKQVIRNLLLMDSSAAAAACTATGARSRRRRPVPCRGFRVALHNHHADVHWAICWRWRVRLGCPCWRLHVRKARRRTLLAALAMFCYLVLLLGVDAAGARARLLPRLWGRVQNKASH